MKQEADVLAIERAHENGLLFAHMFEFSADQIFGYTDPDSGNQIFAPQLPRLCNVLNAKVEPVKVWPHFSNSYRDVYAIPDEGYPGLATTALKNDVPVPLWTQMSEIGLLFDGMDEQHFKPLHVASRDTFSHVGDGKLMIKGPEAVAFREMSAAQGFGVESDADWKEPVFDLNDRASLDPHIAKARGVLPLLWDTIKALRWDDYTSGHMSDVAGVNEVNALAHLGAVRGVVVSEIMRDRNNPVQVRRFATRALQAKEVSEWLHRTYPDTFEEPPPVCAYDHTREKDRLVVLSPEQLADRDALQKFYMDRHPPGAMDGPGGPKNGRNL
jgi:hypothetical protein